MNSFCKFYFISLFCAFLALQAMGADHEAWLDSYDVVWDSPSADSRGSMPLGNGEVTLNAWVEPNGDLQFYIGRSDSYSEISRLLKVGLIRVSLSPNPFEDGQPFSQHLHLRDGIIEISGGAKTNKVTLDLFIDPDRPVIYVTGMAAKDETVTVNVESWRTEPRTLKTNDVSDWTMEGAPFPLVESADQFQVSQAMSDDSLVWYHRNETSVVPDTLSLQGLTNAADVAHDPLLRRTFGGLVVGDGFVARDARTLATEKPMRSFGIHIACPCFQADNMDDWMVQAVADAAASSDVRSALKRNAAWWHDYWNRSWIDTTGNAPTPAITRGYELQRYMQACGGRGTLPIKFNGGAFTVPPDGRMDDSDFRRWGDCHWWQNIRHMYYPMMESGDIEMTDPFFKMYEDAVPICAARAKIYEGVDGVYFPETMTIWGTYGNNNYGWNRTGHVPSDVLCPWWAKTRSQGPELVGMMLDRWDYTQDTAFLQNQLLPMATAVLAYFDERFPRDSRGKLLLTPTQVIETYWDGVTNDTPTIAGLRNITDRLSALPEDLTTPDQRHLFQKMLAACPELPMQDVETNGASVRVIAPAQDYNPKRHNVENPELYAVWPFHLYGLDKPGLDIAQATYALRGSHKLDEGWGPDGNCAAVLGMTDEAARILEVKCKNSNPKYRWPATWGPNFDWMPDQNHGGNLLNTAQLMLCQAVGRKILLFPAWPRDWDVDFKLHMPYQTTVEATLHHGKLTRLKVTPKSRAADVVNELGLN
ncbi:MAG TPA: DUF5703 domain-containing protein [Candidatus Acidoferrales bacterium]|jgi:hypothetical protein|nr:DUF5703 domain-containing protein [Candidatus Acidoferrales bacterium]